jgi:hypothetical protein
MSSRHGQQPGRGSYRRGCDNILLRLGLKDPNAQIAIDAGETYSGTGQTFQNFGQGTGNDFVLGTANTVAANDPTFNGTPRAFSDQEFFSFDGADVFRYAQANAAWMLPLHRAGAKWTFMSWWFFPASFAADSGIVGTSGAANVGFSLAWNINRTLEVTVRNGATVNLTRDSIATGRASAWNFAAVSLDATNAASGLIMQVNDVAEVSSGTLAGTLSVAAPTNIMEIGARGAVASPAQAGSRFSMMAALDVALPQEQIMSFFNETRGRFGV